MKIGMMNVKITIQKQNATVDSIGNRTNTWTAYHTCRAIVSGESGTERQAAAQTVDHHSTTFTVRWCDATKAITPENYRVMLGSEIYNIESVDHVQYRRKEIALKCTKEMR